MYPPAPRLPGELSRTPLLSPGRMNWPFNTGFCYRDVTETESCVNGGLGDSALHVDVLPSASLHAILSPFIHTQTPPLTSRQSCQAHALSGTGLHSYHTILGLGLPGRRDVHICTGPVSWVARTALGSKSLGISWFVPMGVSRGSEIPLSAEALWRK